MKEYYVDWISEDQEQIEGREPHNDIRSDGELTEAETAEEAVENVRQWILDQIAGWTDADGNYYEWEAEETDDGDIIIWDIGGENKKLIAAYLDFKARERMVTMTIYDYEELKNKVLSVDATQDDINALGEWFEQYGDRYWNGECFSVENGIHLYRIEEEVDEDEWEIKGYELR